MNDQPTTPAPQDTEQPADQTVHGQGVASSDETPAADEGVQNDDAVQAADPENASEGQ